MKIVAVGEGSGNKPSKVNIVLGKAGFEYATLDMRCFCPENLIEYKEACYEEYLENKGKSDKEDILLTEEPYRMEELVSDHLRHMQMHGIVNEVGVAPTLPDDSKRTDLDWLIEELALESLKVCKMAGCSGVIVEPLAKNVCSREDVCRNRDFYLHLAAKAKELDIKILIKNRYNVQGERFVRGYMSDAYKLGSFIDELNEKAGVDVFAICLDIGVCNLLGQNTYDVIVRLGERISAVIMRENDGIRDNYIVPFSCIDGKVYAMNWAEIIKGLRKIKFDGILIFDFSRQRKMISHLLWEDLTKYAKKIADFLYWQINMENVIRRYDKRVLFGAGNMCRNYMKCYGKDYPPLYTCDNNNKIWGTYFEGLEIKNPEELKKLPEDCAIFICNVFYDEIGAQLKNMGITNPIERFNDEYMPSSYTDRFDSKTRTAV